MTIKTEERFGTDLIILLDMLNPSKREEDLSLIFGFRHQSAEHCSSDPKLLKIHENTIRFTSYVSVLNSQDELNVPLKWVGAEQSSGQGFFSYQKQVEPNEGTPNLKLLVLTNASLSLYSEIEREDLNKEEEERIRGEEENLKENW